ncbi:MAG: hypothetical protein JSW66_17915 [Phycisphaerales bacterium]|nr:MAG: hypothetical protein JSW66_17915 [Phycisphaerales bacterium]
MMDPLKLLGALAAMVGLIRALMGLVKEVQGTLKVLGLGHATAHYRRHLIDGIE